jgi:hypothetical protein
MEIDAQGRLYVLSREQNSAGAPDNALTRNIVRRIDPATLDASAVEAPENGTGPVTIEQWNLLAVDGGGAIHVGGNYAVIDASTFSSTERAFAQKYAADLAFQWRGEGPLPVRIGAYNGTVEPTGLHVTTQGVTLIGMTHAVANDGFYKVTRGETMRFSPEGALAWHRYLDAETGDDFYGKGFYPKFSEVDADGSVYLAGSQSVAATVPANFAKYSSDGLLQFIRLLDANHVHSDFTLAANGNPVALSALNDPAGTSVILELQNPALVLTPPITVTITKPLEGGRVPHPAMINLAATVTEARPGVTLEEVVFYVDGVRVGAKTEGPFSIFVDNPGLGVHTLLVTGTVRNMGEFASAPVSFTVGNGAPPPVTSNLTVSLAGPANSGSVTAGFLGETVRVEGRTYQVTATAKPGFLFSHWTGGSTATARTLQFVMTPGLELTAHFVVNPFLLTQGKYAGLGELTAGGGGTALGRIAFSATVNRSGAVSFKI